MFVDPPVTPGVVCQGDEYTIPCPHCGRQQHYVAKDIRWPTREGYRVWVRPCRDCGKSVEYHAQLALRVTAEQCLPPSGRGVD